jgi:hypothetical protein
MAASAAIAYHPRMFTLERVVILRQVPTPAAAARTAPTVSRHRVAHHSVHPKNSTRDMEDPVMEGSMAILDAPAASKASVNSFAGLVEISNRDFSMDKPASPAVKPAPQAETGMADQNQPFVPHSSFSFQYTDTIPPEIKLAMMQELTQRELRIQIFKLELGLKQELAILQQQQAALQKALSSPNRIGLANSPDETKLRELLQQQTRLQQEFRVNLENLQRQLQKTSRQLTIVYI